MKVKVRDIPLDGLDLTETLKASEIGLEDKDIKCLGPLEISAHVEKAQDAVIASVGVKGHYEFTCLRCLDPVECRLSDNFDLYFDVDSTVEYVDLGEDLRQEMIVAYCAEVLCKDDCKGMCLTCGANLNHEECKCHKK
ncbi:MAG: DUF177 domain-containing protein [Candidatus Omnitrophota bacterium]|nr:DUF177 domain-containing protein [Candidatus Omnitrophota bacterium]MDZ4241836.1 DUF177 domain-containing protein [Candidatus Omnitrophota bacterium]